jgi:sugar/nucleoside kinase (ribokinase family)
LGNNKESTAIRRAIKSADIFLPNAQEARRLTGEQELVLAIFRLSQPCSLVVVKDGCNGSLAWSQCQLIKVPSILVKPVDTTGAGDNFTAGFLRAWLDEKHLEICLKWGNIVGGLSTTVLVGTTLRITCNEVNQYLQNWLKL